MVAGTHTTGPKADQVCDAVLIDVARSFDFPGVKRRVGTNCGCPKRTFPARGDAPEVSAGCLCEKGVRVWCADGDQADVGGFARLRFRGSTIQVDRPCDQLLAFQSEDVELTFQLDSHTALRERVGSTELGFVSPLTQPETGADASPFQKSEVRGAILVDVVLEQGERRWTLEYRRCWGYRGSGSQRKAHDRGEVDRWNQHIYRGRI